MSLRVNSEIGKLSSVLVHLPGPEIDRMVPAMMEELLFDDILFGARAREEHRRFQQVLGYVADEVLEAEQLLAEVLAVQEHRDAVLEDLAANLRWGPDMDYRLRDLSGEELASVLITGIEKPAIERLAESFKAQRSPVKRLLVVAIPPERSTMHLDTVFTAISREECLVYGPMILAGGEEEADVYQCDLTRKEINWRSESDL